MKSKKRTSNLLIISILFIGLIVRLFFFFILTPWDSQAFKQEIYQFGDAAEYNVFAISIWKTNSLSGVLDTRTPGYPLLIAFFYYFFGQKGAWLILVFQIILDLLTIYLVYLIGKRLSSLPWVGPVAALLYATNFQSALYSNKLLTEIPFAFLIALTAWLLIQAFQQHKKTLWLLGASAIALGTATLIRPIGLYLPIVVILFWLIAAKYRQKKLLIKKPFIRAIGESALFLFIFALVIFPWMAYNKNLYGYYGLATIQGKNLCCYNAPYLKSYLEGISFDEAKEYFPYNPSPYENPFTLSRDCQQKAISYIAGNLNHLVHYIPLHLRGILIMFLGVGQNDISYLLNKEIADKDFMEGSLATRFITELRSSKDQYFLIPILLLRQILECLLFLAGAIILLIKKNARNEKLCAILIILFILYFANLTGVIGHTRFRIPITPLYLIFSSYGLMIIINKFRCKT